MRWFLRFDNRNHTAAYIGPALFQHLLAQEGEQMLAYVKTDYNSKAVWMVVVSQRNPAAQRGAILQHKVFGAMFDHVDFGVGVYLQVLL